MAKRGGFPGGAMPRQYEQNLMKQAQRMQRQMEEKARKSLKPKEFSATAGGGAVEANGDWQEGDCQREAVRGGSGSGRY